MCLSIRSSHRIDCVRFGGSHWKSKPIRLPKTTCEAYFPDRCLEIFVLMVMGTIKHRDQSIVCPRLIHHVFWTVPNARLPYSCLHCELDVDEYFRLISLTLCLVRNAVAIIAASILAKLLRIRLSFCCVLSQVDVHSCARKKRLFHDSW